MIAHITGLIWKLKSTSNLDFMPSFFFMYPYISYEISTQSLILQLISKIILSFNHFNYLSLLSVCFSVAPHYVIHVTRDTKCYPEAT